MAIVFAKDALMASGTSHLATNLGILDNDRSLVDSAVCLVKDTTRRYRLGVNCGAAAVVVAAFTLLTAESPFAHSPIARALARVQLSRGASAVALLASIGSEDQARDGAEKKRY
jgi:hypothetical protein